MNKETIINEFKAVYPTDELFEGIENELNAFLNAKDNPENKQDYLIAYTNLYQILKGDYYCDFFTEKQFKHLCNLIEL